MKFKVAEKFTGWRLDRFLNEKIKKQTRSQLQKIIKAGAALVNGKVATPHHFLKSGDLVTIESMPPPTTKLTPLPATLPTDLTPTVIFEDNDVVILDKPIGLLVHATEKNEPQTLVAWLIKRYPSIAQVGEQNYRAGIIHRLDRDVSGVMVAVKNQKAFDHLKRQFKERQVKKQYFAIVYGQLTNASGEIDLPIGRNPDGQFVAHPRRGVEKFQPNDKIAKTKYRVLDYIKDYSVLEVEILTGRTHQIRAHLSAINHPIIGDRLYKPKKKIFHFLRRRIKVIDPGRLMLHSQKIGFYDLNHQWVEFTSPVPVTITNFINANQRS